MAKEYWVTIKDSEGHAVQKLNALYITNAHIEGTGTARRIVVYMGRTMYATRGSKEALEKILDAINLRRQEVLYRH